MEQPDAVLQTTVFVQAEDSLSISFGESVVIGAKIWLVLSWYELPGGKWRTPARSVRVDLLRHQRGSESGWGELLLEDAIPKSVVTGEPSPQSAGYELVESLPVKVPVRREH